jgi:hypothetical protein
MGQAQIFELAGQAFGVLAIVTGVISMQLSKRWQILLALAFLNLFLVFNQLFLGMSFSAIIGCGLAAIHCPVNAYKVKRGKPAGRAENVIWSVLYFASWGVGLYISARMGIASWLDILPFFGVLTFIISVYVPRERDVRIFTLLNALVYLVYNALNMNIAAVSQVLTIISVIVALVRYRERASVEAVEECDKTE